MRSKLFTMRSIGIILVFLFHQVILCYGQAIIFEIRNNCPYTVWAAAAPGGGRRLNQGQTWILDVPGATTAARVWGRTNCTFDASGRGRCQTGDCAGLLECTGWGQPPNTLAETGQLGNTIFYDISLIDGFNIPIGFGPVSGPRGTCRPVSCTADINGQCPEPLRAPGGCNHPCTVFGTEQYCCTRGPCIPTDYSRFFRQMCPEAYSFPQEGPAGPSCPSGTNLTVVFCPNGSSQVLLHKY